MRSTPRKLLMALDSWAQSQNVTPSQFCFIGAVQYKTEEEIHKYFADTIECLGLNAFDDPAVTSEALLMKRSGFQHEREIRLIYIQSRDIPRQDVVKVKIDPNVVFEEISFDPRLALFERKEREQHARNLGYNGPFLDLGTYHKKELIILIP